MRELYRGIVEIDQATLGDLWGSTHEIPESA